MSTITNPVLRGTQPDPSVVRVGEDFYLATSSFDLLPGIQIRHSRDLVHWTLIGAAVRRPTQYRRDGAPGAISLFAPTLRFHDGVFYVVCTNVADDQGNFVVRTTDPAGEWSDAVWIDRGAFDPSLLFDDGGRCLYTRRTLDRLPDGRLGGIVQAELDVETGKLGRFVEITKDSQGFCSNDIEGPHLYRIEDWYYLFSAEGGSWAGHMQTCARSRSPWGPFDPAPDNPVLTHRHRVAHPIQTLGHAELVDDPSGNWWALALGTRHTAREGFVLHHNLGRETFLAPVRWVDGWPVIGDAGTIELEMEVDVPLPGSGVPAEASGSARRAIDQSPAWRSGWRSIGAYSAALDEPVDRGVTVPAGVAFEQATGTAAVGALLRAQTEDRESVAVDVDLPAEGAAIGVAVHADGAHFYSLVLERHGDVVQLTFERRVDDLVHRAQEALECAAGYELRIDADEDEYAFSLTPAGGAARQIGSGSARLLSAESVEWFVGVHFALLNVAAGPTAAEVRFSDYRQRSAVPVRSTELSGVGPASVGGQVHLLRAG